MTKILFVCDESGAKGYADRDETYPGETGVFAGILVPEEELSIVEPLFQAIYERYKPSTGKLHVTDLSTEDQASLREDIYRTILQLGLPCFWYAIHVAGLHDWHNTLLSEREKAVESLNKSRGEIPPRIKRGSPREDVASLHVELFAGLYSHLIAFLEERGLKDVEIEIRTDKVDSPVVREFEKVAKGLLLDEPTVERSTGFDTVTQQLVHGEIRVQIVNPPAVGVRVTSLALDPSKDHDGLVLAADVIANSLNYLFKHRTEEERFRPLNHPDAVAGHPLAKCFDTFWNWGDGDIIGDRLYSHPQGK